MWNTTESFQYVRFGTDVLVKKAASPPVPSDCHKCVVVYCIDQLAAPLCDALTVSRPFLAGGSIYVTDDSSRTKVSDISVSSDGSLVLVRNVIGASIPPSALRSWVAASTSGLNIDKAIILDGLCVRAYHDGSAILGGSHLSFLHTFAAIDLVQHPEMHRYTRFSHGKMMLGCTAALLNFFETKSTQALAFISERDLTYSVESARRFESLIPLLHKWSTAMTDSASDASPTLKPSPQMYYSYVAKDAYLINTASLYC